MNKLLRNPSHPRYSTMFKHQIDKFYKFAKRDYDESFHGKFQTFFIDAKVKIIQLMHENLTIIQVLCFYYYFIGRGFGTTSKYCESAHS